MSALCHKRTSGVRAGWVFSVPTYPCLCNRAGAVSRPSSNQMEALELATQRSARVGVFIGSARAAGKARRLRYDERQIESGAHRVRKDLSRRLWRRFDADSLGGWREG